MFPGKVERNFARLGRIMVQIAGVMSQRRRRESKIHESVVARPTIVHSRNKQRITSLMSHDYFDLVFTSTGRPSRLPIA